MDAGEPRFFSRDLSWLEFNARVLAEARDASLPLLERLKFLAITASNLDEFTMVRVGSLQILHGQGVTTPDPAGLSPSAQLVAISQRMQQMVSEQYHCYLKELEPALARRDLRRLLPAELNATQSKILEEIFLREVFPVLTPLAIGDPLDLPLLMNLTLTLAVRLAPLHDDVEPRYALIPLGRALPRIWSLPVEAGYGYVLLEDMLTTYLDRFFPGEAIEESTLFRITRNADLQLQEDQASDLLAEMQEILDARRESACVRLELAQGATRLMLTTLQALLKVPSDFVFMPPGPLDLNSHMRLADVPGFESLKYEPWPPRPSGGLDLSESLFSQIAAQDVLLYHPYESFDPVVKLLEEAADDPDVVAIKQTLYRTSRNSPMVAALRRAAQKGKYVTAVVELKARFDEARNIEWARDLEHHDVQVIYGVKRLKTHAKMLLIVRREPHGLQRYVHVGTGNYNEQTARLYSDASLMTCDEDIGADASNFFNAITGYSQPQRFRKLEVAPIGMREKILELIDAEKAYHTTTKRGLIVAKLNALVDEQLIEALYSASKAGVRVRLSVRGVCCLRPGVPGLSTHITVSSVIDRFLEHSRLMYFAHGGESRVFLSSADWMPRNLDRRVELLAPVDSPQAKARLVQYLRIHLKDNVKAWRLNADGKYQRVVREDGQESIRSQEWLYRHATETATSIEKQRPTMFEPHRAPGADEEW